MAIPDLQSTVPRRACPAGPVKRVLSTQTRTELRRAAAADGGGWRGPNAHGDTARTPDGEGAQAGAKLQVLQDGRPALERTVAAFDGRQWAGTDADPHLRRWRPHPHLHMLPQLVVGTVKNGFLGHRRPSPTGSGPEGPGEGGAQ